MFACLTLDAMNHKKTWNKVAEIYSDPKTQESETFVYEELVNTPSLLNLCKRQSVKNVLDLGSGDGRFTYVLYKNFPNVVGSDYSSQMIEVAKRKFPYIEFLNIDLKKPFPKFISKFDLITAKLVLMHVDDINLLALECAKTLSMGGILVVSVTHPMRWFYCYFENQSGVRIREGFDKLDQGYFSKGPVTKAIGKKRKLSFEFINRTISDYVNAFTSVGLVLDSVDEPELTEEYKNVVTNYRARDDVPLRLNLRFMKI